MSIGSVIEGMDVATRTAVEHQAAERKVSVEQIVSEKLASRPTAKDLDSLNSGKKLPNQKEPLPSVTWT